MSNFLVELIIMAVITTAIVFMCMREMITPTLKRWVCGAHGHKWVTVQWDKMCENCGTMGDRDS
jgi:hypothetical protein